MVAGGEPGQRGCVVRVLQENRINRIQREIERDCLMRLWNLNPKMCHPQAGGPGKPGV